MKSPPGEDTPQKNSPGAEAITDDKLMSENENDLIKLTLPPKANLEAPESLISREYVRPTRHTHSPPVQEPRGLKQHNYVFTKACADRQYNYIRKKSELEIELETDLDKTNEEIELIDLGINMTTLGQLQFEQAQYSR